MRDCIIRSFPPVGPDREVQHLPALGQEKKWTRICSTRGPGPRRPAARDLGEKGPLSQGIHAGRKVLRIRHVNGMEVRKKRPRGFT
jgi:hypothetical protein